MNKAKSYLMISSLILTFSTVVYAGFMTGSGKTEGEAIAKAKAAAARSCASVGKQTWTSVDYCKDNGKGTWFSCSVTYECVE